MRSSKHFFTKIPIVVFVLTITLLVACDVPPAVPAPPDKATVLRDELAAPAVEQVDRNPPVSSVESASSPTTSMPSGPELLRSQCARCHLPALLEQIEKPRTEWEAILERMAALGVQLSGPEKDILLDFFTTDLP